MKEKKKRGKQDVYKRQVQFRVMSSLLSFKGTAPKSYNKCRKQLLIGGTYLLLHNFRADVTYRWFDFYRVLCTA